MRLESATIDARDPAALARFWSAAVGWPIVFESDEEWAVAPDDRTFPQLLFVWDADPAAGHVRIHLDLNSASTEEQAATVERLRALGAAPVDVGQPADAPFVVLADPEGNPFCVLDPRPQYQGAGPIASIVVASGDPWALADFWAAATGWERVELEDGVVSFRSPDGAGPLLELVHRDPIEPKTAKDRIHLDVAPGADEDQAAVVDALQALGARPVDIGQGPDVTWVVLADPEDNELCVLSPRD